MTGAVPSITNGFLDSARSFAAARLNRNRLRLIARPHREDRGIWTRYGVQGLSGNLNQPDKLGHFVRLRCFHETEESLQFPRIVLSMPRYRLN